MARLSDATQQPSSGLRVDLLIRSTPYKLLGMVKVGFDPEIIVAPLRAARLLRAEPRDAQGGRLFELILENGTSVALPLGVYAGTVTIGAHDDKLRIGVPMVALPFVQSLDPYVVEVTPTEGGRLLTLDLPRNKVASFTVAKVTVSLRIPA